MSRPCRCDRTRNKESPGADWQHGDCRLCWLHYDPGPLGEQARREWALRERADARNEPCRHLGKVLDRRDRICPGCWVYGCDLFGRCIPKEGESGEIACCATCPVRRTEADERPEPELLLLRNRLSPGDVVVMTGAVACLHRAHPGRYVTLVKTSCDAVFEASPHARPPRPWERERARTVEMQYPLIHQSNQRPVHFLQGYCDHLAEQLHVSVPLVVNRPCLYLADREKRWLSQVQEITGKPTQFWLINAGHKQDFTAKFWGRSNYQRLVDELASRVQFVQVGRAEHQHAPLRGVIDLRGKTDDRQLIRLCYHAAGGVGPSTFLQHCLAAFDRPYVCIAGGREPLPWLHYPSQTTLSRVGQLDCCASGGCWKSRVQALPDGQKSLNESLCSHPIHTSEAEVIPQCLTMTGVDEVAAAVLRYYDGGRLTRART